MTNIHIFVTFDNKIHCCYTSIDLVLQEIGLVDGTVKSICNISTFSVVTITMSLPDMATLQSNNTHVVH